MGLMHRRPKFVKPFTRMQRSRENSSDKKDYQSYLNKKSNHLINLLNLEKEFVSETYSFVTQ